MTKSTQKALKYLDAILAKGGEDARDLWDVLSALRGPDSQDDVLKDTVTCPIRRAAFPKTTKRLIAGDIQIGPVFASYNGRTKEYDAKAASAGTHFAYHAREAWRALNKR